ncbi:tetratricopeptide repeat protein [Rhodobacteraceae bacterium N5(2021)]|uniref:Tetratricopeptide repeat protein n=1 Tax=Gymnodinialimonas phycosphaerae TaxID=2841589 RepID=A0A975TUA9_9RHOB|nr:tetratricopeptide repeat protein [Gymnodinialimonas phycosphaerae]MBY4895033.1 tetratricopeptide repeat protein [Gymnodinialimonas phycosphaerae]
MVTPEQFFSTRQTVLKHAPLILLMITLTACTLTPRLDVGDGVNAPASVGQLDDSQASLITGDRLMEAGEYELALRAYYRAGVEDGLSVDVITAIGAANLALGRLGQAEEQFRAALQRQNDFVPALNNLGAVLIEQGEYGEARRLLEQAFALDSGSSETIRDNLRLAIARMENQVYTDDEQERPTLIRRGGGRYTLQSSL